MVKASQSGIVSNLQARVGKRASNILPLLFILPGSSELTVKMLVPVRAAGFVERNQTLNIRFDAFPYQKFGVYLGKVSDVSNTILLPNEQVEFPIRSDEPVYTIYGNLETQLIVEGDKQFRLKSGMTLSADIQLDSRSILQWLFEPIFSLKGRM